VWGEVYEVDEDLLRELDKREAGYSRVRVEVVMAGLKGTRGAPRLEAWMYMWRGSVDPSRMVPEGDFSYIANLDPIIPYFAYGRNLNIARFVERIGEGKIVAMAPARLRRHRLVFDKPCGEGVCAALDHTGDNRDYVAGVVYYVRRSAFERLDKFEGHPTEYERRVLPVELLCPPFRRVYAVVYEAARRGGSGVPECSYLCDIVHGLRLHGHLEESFRLQREYPDCNCDGYCL
jgi:gamma-glutamylcyclotransferase (GGCT)/AIG2-like uncharacterized protein YtfP